jgi:hypothetical protein
VLIEFYSRGLPAARGSLGTGLPYSPVSGTPIDRFISSLRFAHVSRGSPSGGTGKRDARSQRPSRGKTDMTRIKEHYKKGMKMYGVGYPGHVVTTSRSEERQRPPSLDQIKRQLEDIHRRVEAMRKPKP